MTDPVKKGIEGAGRDRLARLVVVYERLEELILGVSLAGALFALLLQVFSRYLFSWPLAWTEELARYLFVWSVFFGASQALRRHEHIAIGLVVERLPTALRRAAAVAMHGLCIVFLAVVAVMGFRICAKVAPLPSTALEVSMAMLYLPLPLAAIAMILRFGHAIWRDVMAGPAAIEHRSL